MFLTKSVENVLKGILLIIIFITPLIFVSSFYFPYVSGKAYFFRLLIELALIPWAILLFKDLKYRPNFKSPLIIALLVFVAALTITAFTGVDFYQSFFSNIERSDGIIQYMHYVLFFLMAISVFKTKKDWQIVLSVFIATALVNSIYAFVHYAQQPRLFGLLGNSSFLGGFLIFAIGFCLLFLVDSFKPFIKKTPIIFILSIAVLALLFAVTLVLTQTRGAFLGVFFGFIIFTILVNFYLWKKSLPDWQTRRKMIIILNSILFIVLALSVSVFIYKDSKFVEKYPIIYRVAHTAESNSAKDRLSEWTTAIKGFKDKPILGWGPENFDVVANKYYDYHIGLYQPWFDRPHNQALQYLAEGGIVLFAAYLFLVVAVFRLIFRIYKKEKILASILSAIYVAYIIQSLILFDALPMFLGLFVLWAFIYFKSEPNNLENKLILKNKIGYSFYAGVVILTIAVIVLAQVFVFVPLQGSQLIIEAFTARANNDYKNENIILDKLFSIKSPYVYAQARRAIGWDFLKNTLEIDIKEQDRVGIILLYEKMISELESWMKYRPVDQQVYYVLGETYRLGYEKLGRSEDLSKAEEVLKRGLNYSTTRIEYIDELGQVLVLQKKFDELDKLMKNFAENVDINDPYRYLSLGHSYFMQNKFDLAIEEYTKAKNLGYLFWQTDRDYYRYLQVAEKLKGYQKIKDITEAYLKNKGDDANTLFNLAIANYYLGHKQEAKDSFEKAVILNKEFENYRKVFGF